MATPDETNPVQSGEAGGAGKVGMMDAPAAFAEQLADYLATRRTPWADEALMRAVVREVVRVVFGGAAYDTARLLPEQAFDERLGAADWLYDREFGGHMPCCSQPHKRWRCGNGPLVAEQIRFGNCGLEHTPDPGVHWTAAPGEGDTRRGAGRSDQ